MAGIIIAGWDPQEGGQVRPSRQSTGVTPSMLHAPQPFRVFVSVCPFNRPVHIFLWVSACRCRGLCVEARGQGSAGKVF